jgi:hypothetical protein
MAAASVAIPAAALSGALPASGAAGEPAKRIDLEPWGVTIEFRAADEKVASEVAEICKKTIPKLSRQIGLVSVSPFRVFLIADIEEYEERVGLALPPWGVAFAFPESRIMLVDVPRAAGAWNTLENVIPHELSHMLLAERAEGVRFPLWFAEGLAQWQAGEWSLAESWRLMESVWARRSPPLARVVSSMSAHEDRARDAYRVSYEAFQYRFDGHTERLGEFLGEAARRGDFGEAFAAFWNESEAEYYARFDEHLARKYSRGLMLFQTGPLFTLASVLFLLVVLRLWLRNRRTLKAMDEAERRRPSGWE